MGVDIIHKMWRNADVKHANGQNMMIRWMATRSVSHVSSIHEMGFSQLSYNKS